MTYDSTQGNFWGVLNMYLDLLSVIRVLKYIVSSLVKQCGVVINFFGWRFRLRPMGSM